MNWKFVMALTLLLGAAPPALAQGQPSSASQTCGVKLDGAGKPLKLDEPLPEETRVGLLASLHLAFSDSSGRGTWPLSEINIALPCEIANFAVGEETWVISAGEGFAPPRWARAKDHEETYFLTAGPSFADARTWAANRSAPTPSIARPTYYLAAMANAQIFVFKVYDGAPGGKLLADDLFDAITEKTAPIAFYDPKGNAASLFLVTQSRRTSDIYMPERLMGERSASLYGPDGHFFSPAPHRAVLLRGSDLQCDDRYGDFELDKLGILHSDDEGLDLSCHYRGPDGHITIFATHLPNTRDDRKTFGQLIKATQDEAGIARRLSSFRVGEKETLQAGSAWMDKAKMGQGIWFMRRGAYVYEIQATSAETATKALLEAVSAFTASVDLDPGQR